jgi:hypothetical protein
MQAECRDVGAQSQTPVHCNGLNNIFAYSLNYAREKTYIYKIKQNICFKQR